MITWARRTSTAVVAATALAALLAGCSGDDADPEVLPPLNAPVTFAPLYNESLEPAAAVLSLVPESATELEVTDFDQIRLRLGAEDVTSDSPAPRRRQLWRAVTERTPILTGGILVSDAALLEADYGLTQDDVAWEARFSGPDGDGWVVRFRDEVPFGPVQEAVDDGAGPFAGADFYSATRIAALGITTDPYESWRADAPLTSLVGQRAQATYLSRECLPFEVAFDAGLEDQLAAAPADDLAGLDELGAFSVSFGSDLVTVQLGAGRADAFDRARLAEAMPATDPEFGLGYVDPVADPASGRIGYAIGDPSLAAELALDRHLPFAVCAP